MDTPETGGMPRLMGIFAHPDDESFGMAGTLARATRAGHPAAIVCATRGERGQIADAALATPERLGHVREGELRAACAVVGVQDVSFLDYVDGHVPEAEEAEAVARIVRHLLRFRPDVVVTFSANGGYGHIDHIAIHQLTLLAVAAAAQGADGHRVRKVYFQGIPRSFLLGMRDAERAQGRDFVPGGDEATLPVEAMGNADDEITTRIDLTDEEFALKQASMRAHATQMAPDSPFVTAAPEQLRRMLGREHFVLAPPPISATTYALPETDLFAGL